MNPEHKKHIKYRIIWTVVFGIGILFAFGCSQVPIVPTKQDIGLRLIQAGNIEEAIKYYDKAIECDPEQSSFYYYRGLARQMKKEFERALEDYSTVIQLDKEFISAYLNRGLIRYQLKELDENLKSKIQGHLKNCMAKIGVRSEENKTNPQTDPIQMPKIQNEALVVSIEVPVRVFKNGKFVDNLSIDDFLVYENGIPQKIKSLYLITKTNISRRELKTGSFNPKVASRHYVLVFEVVEYMPEIGLV